MKPLPFNVYLNAQRRKQELALAAVRERGGLSEESDPTAAAAIEESLSAAYKAGYEAGQQQSRADILAVMPVPVQPVQPADETKRMLDVIETSLKRELARYRRELERDLFDIMRFFLEESISARSHNEIRKAVRSLLDVSGSATITVTGDQKIIAMLQDRFENRISQLNLVENDEQLNVTIVLDQTVINTKLNEWRQKIGDLLEAGTEADG